MLILRRPTSQVKVNIISATLRIPQELVDQIVDCLSDDPRSIRSCSLVCGSFLPRTSAYMLRTLRLRTTQLPRFLPILSLSRRLASYVTEHHIIDDDARQLTPSILYNTIILLPRLQTLVFTGPFRMFSSSTVLLPSHARRSLKTLRFQYLHVDLVESVVELFKSVDDLSIEGRYIDGSLAAPRMVGEVKNLHVRIDARYLCAILKLFRPSCLASIDLDLGTGESLKAHYIDQFLQIYGGGIERLSLKLSRAGLDSAGSITSLETCTRLREVVLTVYGRQPINSILPCLPCQIRRLRLNFSDTYSEFVKQCDWQKLEEHLSHCDQLRVLELRGPPSFGSTDRDHAVIRSKLSARLIKMVHFVG